MLNRIKSLFGIETRSTNTLKWPSPEMMALFGATPTASGVAVSPSTALRSPTTLAACRVIAESMGSLPYHLFRRDASGSRERDTTHPAAAILAGDWAPWAGGVETKTALQFDALLHGAGYALKVTSAGKPRELHRLDPTCTTRDDTGPEPVFKVSQGGAQITYDWRDVLYLPTPGAAAGRPLCLITQAREAIALDLVMAEHQARLFSNGARPGGIIKYGKALNEDTVKRLRESFQQVYAGGANSGRTAILEDGMEFEALQFSSTDAQFLELRRLVMQEIARAFKVPATLVGDFDRATWRNVEELMRQFVQTCLMPWAEIWQAGLERVLLTPEERQTYFIEAVFDDMLRGDLTARFTAYRQATGGSWLTPNEIRALDNRPPIAGGDDLIRQAGQSDTGAPQPQAVKL